MSSDGANVYVAGGAADDLAVFARNAATGVLTFVEEERYGDSAHGIDRSNSVVVTADGASLYVAVFARDAATGRLTFSARPLISPATDRRRSAPFSCSLKSLGFASAPQPTSRSNDTPP